ncbi:MAG: hypothetical protein AB4368_23480 [Xenococcaceae cyanobacterium]
MSLSYERSLVTPEPINLAILGGDSHVVKKERSIALFQFFHVYYIYTTK